MYYDNKTQSRKKMLLIIVFVNYLSCAEFLLDN